MMASISHDKRTGRRAIQFVGPDGKRRSIRFGKVNKKQAESAKLFIEDLVACKIAGTSPKNTTAAWIASLSNTVRGRLERGGLIGPQERRERLTLADWLKSYIASRSDVKPNTRRNLEQTQNSLIGFFSETKLLDEVTPRDAEEFRI